MSKSNWSPRWSDSEKHILLILSIIQSSHMDCVTHGILLYFCMQTVCVCVGVGETHAVAYTWKTSCKSCFFPANVCMHWRAKADATRFGSWVSVFAGLSRKPTFSVLNWGSYASSHNGPEWDFLDVCLYIMYYTFIFVNKYLIKRKDYYIILKIFSIFIYFILFMNDLSACMSECYLHP